MNKKLVAVAVVRKPFGLKGEVKIKPLTDSWNDVLHFTTFLLRDKDNQLKEVHVEAVKLGGGHLILKFKEFSSRNETQKISGSILFVPKDELPEINEPDTYYYFDLIGMEVYEETEFIGIVGNIHRFGSNETLEIIQKDGPPVLLPFVKEFIRKVDLHKRKIFIKSIPGLW